MKNPSIVTASTVTALVVGFIVAVSIARATQTPTALEVVKEVCDYSRTVQSKKWEDACGQAQDSANSEYLCNSYDSKAKCWVEAK